MAFYVNTGIYLCIFYLLYFLIDTMVILGDMQCKFSINCIGFQMCLFVLKEKYM